MSGKMKDEVYDPSLRRAQSEIEAILEREDIGGVVMLHSYPGSFAAFSALEPSYARIASGELPSARSTVLMMRMFSKFSAENALTLDKLANELSAILAETSG
jgi:hypothetical protein